MKTPAKQLMSCLLMALAGCSEQAPAPKPVTPPSSHFAVHMPGEAGFDSSSAGASAHRVQLDALGLKTYAQHVRLKIRADQTPRLDQRMPLDSDVLVSTLITVDGQQRRIACFPSKPLRGWLLYSQSTEGRLNGAFELDIDRCQDYASGAAVDYPGGQVTVRGEWTHLPLRDDD